MVNIYEDTCSTCKKWQSTSRQSRFGGCPEKQEGVTGTIIMAKDEVCGLWESMVEPETEPKPEPEPEPEPEQDYKQWDDFYKALGIKI